MLLCASTERSALAAVELNDPPKPKSPKGGQREPPDPGRIRVAARFEETSRTPAMRETTHRWLVSQRQPERSEVRPVARGQRTAKSGGRPRADGGDAETKLRTCLNLVRRPVAQPSAQAGREASLDIRRLIGCRLPDAILHGQRSSFGLVAGPSSALRSLNFE